MVVVIISIICEKVLGNAGSIFSSFSLTWSYFKKLVSPFIIGFFIAYLFNPIVSTIEKALTPALKNSFSVRRTLSILITYIIIIGCAVWLLAVFIPSMSASIRNFILALPRNIDSFKELIYETLNKTELINADDVIKMLDTLFTPVMNISQNVPSVLQVVLNGTFVAASNMISVLLGIFISFYMLYGKESFCKETKKIMYAFGDENKITKLLNNISRINDVFTSFIVGKTIDSAIIGVICVIGLSFIGTTYAVVISVIVGITNMIPYFGPFIGAVPAVLIVLLTTPSKAIWVALFIFGLQQFDGAVLGPKILGDSTGMNPLWIILSIILGGAIAGPLGMFLGVPICASIKLFFGEEVDRRYSQKYYYKVRDEMIDPHPLDLNTNKDTEK